MFGAKSQAGNGLAAIKANIRIGTTIEDARRMETPHYPDKVFRELLVNAVVHRNYSIIGSQVRVFLFQDRLEVMSPGRLPNTVSIEKLPVGTSFGRNPPSGEIDGEPGIYGQTGKGATDGLSGSEKAEEAHSF